LKKRPEKEGPSGFAACPEKGRLLPILRRILLAGSGIYSGFLSSFPLPSRTGGTEGRAKKGANSLYVFASF